MVTRHEIIDGILNQYRNELAGYFVSYHNHVYRVYNLAVQSIKSEEEKNILAIAAAYHDLGIWTNQTFDYLLPSVALVNQYAATAGLDAEMLHEISVIIMQHHKITAEKSSETAEIFRQADLVDLSLGVFRCGIQNSLIRETRKAFPNKGFHIYLSKLFLKNLFTNPLNPLPMYKW